MEKDSIYTDGQQKHSTDCRHISLSSPLFLLLELNPPVSASLSFMDAVTVSPLLSPATDLFSVPQPRHSKVSLLVDKPRYPEKSLHELCASVPNGIIAPL